MQEKEEAERKYLDFKEMKQLLNVVKEIPAEHILIRLLANGLAPRDLIRIKVKHFKFGKGLVRFKGKKNMKREADIDLPTLAIIQEHIKKEKMGKGDAILPWSREQYLSEIVKRNAEVASLGASVTPTLLRDTWTYLAVRQGKDLDYIHKQLGNTTLKHTQQLVDEYRERDRENQPFVEIFIPIHEAKKPVVEATLKAIAALDYKNYTVTLGVNNSSSAFVTWLKKLVKSLLENSRVVDLGEIDAREEVEIDGKTFLAEIEKGKVVSFARKARNEGLELFRKGIAGYVVMCDADCPPKPFAIKRCLKYFNDKRYEKVGVVSGVVFIRASGKLDKDGKTLHAPAIYFDTQKRENWCECYEFFFTNWKDIEIIEVDGVGMGWTMISREATEEVNFDFPKDLTRFMGEDYYYCHQIKEKGFMVLCLGEVIADHLEDEDDLANIEGTHTDVREEASETNDTSVEVVSEFTSDFYDEEYFEDGLKNKKSGYIGYFNHPLFKAIAKELHYYFKPKKALDIGAGKGYLVEELVHLNIDASGIDISEYAVKNAPKEIRDRITQGTSTKMAYEDKQFDLVVTFDMMEHLNEEQYRATIREMARVSSKNLLFSITTADNVIDKSHVSIMPIDKWKKIIDEEIGESFYRHRSNFLDQSILWFSPQMCVIYTRKKKQGPSRPR